MSKEYSNLPFSEKYIINYSEINSDKHPFRWSDYSDIPEGDRKSFHTDTDGILKQNNIFFTQVEENENLISFVGIKKKPFIIAYPPEYLDPKIAIVIDSLYVKKEKRIQGYFKNLLKECIETIKIIDIEGENIDQIHIPDIIYKSVNAIQKTLEALKEEFPDLFNKYSIEPPEEIGGHYCRIYLN